MMKILKRIVIAVVVLAVILVGVSFLLPKDVHVERSRTIDAPREAVFALVNDMSKFNQWSPWAKLDPKTEYTFTGPESGIGSKMAWHSDDPHVGSGTQEIIESKAPSWVKSKLDFGEHGTGYATFILEDTGGNTTVTWGFDGDMGNNPVMRYMGLAMDSMLGPTYEEGLQSLAKAAESTPATEAVADAGITVEEVTAKPIAFVTGEAEPMPEKIGPALDKAYTTLGDYLSSKGVEPAGPAIAITKTWDKDRYQFEAAYPLQQENEVKAGGDVKVGETYAGKVVRGVHKGPYEDIKDTYGKISAYMDAHGLEPAGDSWEEYVNDPKSTPKDELLTNVYFPAQPKEP